MRAYGAKTTIDVICHDGALVGALVVTWRLRLRALPNPVAMEGGCSQRHLCAGNYILLVLSRHIALHLIVFSMQAMASRCHLPGTRALHTPKMNIKMRYKEKLYITFSGFRNQTVTTALLVLDLQAESGYQ